MKIQKNRSEVLIVILWHNWKKGLLAQLQTHFGREPNCAIRILVTDLK